MTVLLLLTLGCRRDGLADGVPVDCYQVASAGRAFTVSTVAPYEWGVGRTTVDATGLQVTPHTEPSVTLSDGTVHPTGHDGFQLTDGGSGLYRFSLGVLERSDDFGLTWVALEVPLSGNLDETHLSVRGDHVLVFLRGMGNNGMVLSSDRGETWTEVPWPTPDSVLLADVWSAAVNVHGHLVAGRRLQTEGDRTDVLFSEDQGQTWVLVDEEVNGASVALGDDGTVWASSHGELYWYRQRGPREGGPVVTALHGSDPAEGPVLEVQRLQPQGDGRMGFVSVAGLGGFERVQLPHAYCVAGPATTGAVVPALDELPPLTFTPGQLQLVEQLPGPAWDFAVVGGQVATADARISFDALPREVFLDGEPLLHTHDDRPEGGTEGLIPVALTAHPGTGGLMIALHATEASDPQVGGELWEVTPQGAHTGLRRVFGVQDGVRLFPVGVFPGPGGLLLAQTTAGTFDANTGQRLGNRGPLAVDPVNADVFYVDVDGWIARSRTGGPGVYADRCAEAVTADQDCYDLGPHLAAALAVDRDRHLYVNTGSAVWRRPIDEPSAGWSLVVDGFDTARVELDTHDGLQRIWVQDGALLWAGVIGDTLPLAR